MATHSSILAWEIPRTEEPGGLQSKGSQRVRDDWVTITSLHFRLHPEHLFSYLFNGDKTCLPASSQCLSSVQFSRSVVSDSLRPHESQHARPPCPSPTPRVHPNLMCIESVMPSSHLILCRPLLLLPPIPPSIRVFFQWVNSSHEVAKVLEFQPQHQSFRWTPRTGLL